MYHRHTWIMFSSLDVYCLWLIFTMQNQRAVGICSTRPKYFFNSNLAKFQLSVTHCFVVSLKFYPEHGSITLVRRLNVILYELVFGQYKNNFGHIFYITTTTNIILNKPNIMASNDLRRHVIHIILMCDMMTSSNGDFFRVTGHLCGEFHAQ